MTSTSGSTLTVKVSDEGVKILRDDAATARKDARLDLSTQPVWDEIVAMYGNGKSEPKRADILRAVLTACGEWKDTPQKVKGTNERTPFGNVVQRFGARFDAAVKRATPDEEKPVVLRASLSGEGGGSTTIEPDHALYAQIVALIHG